MRNSSNAAAAAAQVKRNARAAGTAGAGAPKPFVGYTAADRELCRHIQEWLDDPGPGRTRAALGRAANISSGTVTLVLSGQYPSPPGEHLEAMYGAIERQSARKNEPADIPFTETSVSRAVHSVIHRAHLDRDFGLFAGRVGIGKSMALRQYHRAHRKVSVLLEAFPGAGAAVVMRLLASAIGAPQKRRTIADITAAVVETLRGSDTIIMVDEAETLTDHALLHLRRVSDAAEVGVVLVGTPALLGLVYDPDGKFGQITSRIGFWPPVAQSITAEDVRALAEAYQPGGEFRGETLLALTEACQGSARAAQPAAQRQPALRAPPQAAERRGGGRHRPANHGRPAAGGVMFQAIFNRLLTGL